MFIDIIADFFPLIVVGEERESERVQPVSGFIPANITQSMTRAHLAQAYNSKIYIENTRVAEPPDFWAAPAPARLRPGSGHFSFAVVLLIMSRL